MSDRLEASIRFAVVPEWVLDHGGLSDRSVRLYGVLARYADAAGVAWPSRTTLAARLFCSRDSVDRALRELEGAGALTKEKRYDDAGDPTSNLYVLHPAGNQLSLPTAPVRRGGRSGAATGGRDGAGRGSRTGAAQNETHSYRESFEREPLLGESAKEPLSIDETLADVDPDRLPTFLRQRIMGQDVPLIFQPTSDEEQTP